MNWASWSEFFAMGGYAFYVWGSFGVTALALLAEIGLLALRRHALAQRESYEIDTELRNETQT